MAWVPMTTGLSVPPCTDIQTDIQSGIPIQCWDDQACTFRVQWHFVEVDDGVMMMTCPPMC